MWNGKPVIAYWGDAGQICLATSDDTVSENQGTLSRARHFLSTPGPFGVKKLLVMEVLPLPVKPARDWQQVVSLSTTRATRL